MVFGKSTKRILGRKAKSFETPEGYMVIDVYQNEKRDCKGIKDSDYECQDNCNELFISAEYRQTVNGMRMNPLGTFLLIPGFTYIDKDTEYVEQVIEEGPHPKNGFAAIMEYCKEHEDGRIFKGKGKIICKLNQGDNIEGMEYRCGFDSYRNFKRYEHSKKYGHLLPDDFKQDVEKTFEKIEKPGNIKFFRKHARKAD